MLKVNAGVTPAVVRNTFQIVDIPYSLTNVTGTFKSRNHVARTEHKQPHS